MIFKLINSNKCHIQMTSSSYVIYLLIKSSAQLEGSSINIKSLAKNAFRSIVGIFTRIQWKADLLYPYFRLNKEVLMLSALYLNLLQHFEYLRNSDFIRFNSQK